MINPKSLTISPGKETEKSTRTVADAMLAIEAKYKATPPHTLAAKRLLSALRTTSNYLSDMFKRPLDHICLNDLVEIEARLIAYIESLGIVHQSAVQYTSDTRKLLDLGHELCDWTSEPYMMRRSWRPIRQVLKGKSQGCHGIVDFAIKEGRTPSNFAHQTMEAWKQPMLGLGRSLLTVSCYESHFRMVLRNAGLQELFPNFALVSKNPPMYRLKLRDLPESLRSEVLEVVQWKTADEDLDDRDASLMIRPVTAGNLIRYFVELYSYAVKILNTGEVANLRQLISEKIVCGFIDWLKENERCRPSSVITKLSSIHFLTRTYPKLKSVGDDDYQWFRTKLDTLRKETCGGVQARKLDGIPDFHAVAEIAPKLLALRQEPNQLSEIDVGWLVHDALIFITSLLTPHRSRNIRETGIHPRRHLNIFETEITSELLTQIKLPAWAKERRDTDPHAKFLVCHWVEFQTKANQEVWELFPYEAIALFKEYVDRYRPILLRGHNPESSDLFFARNRKQLTQKSLLNLVARISVRYTGKRITVKLFRDLVAAHMLATGATVEEVAACLWHLDPYSTTVRFYISGFNTSHAVIALEDEVDALLEPRK